MALLGANGAGKTTTIRMMLGLLKPTNGTIRVLQASIPSQITEILPRIGYMSQHFSLYSDITVQQNLEFYGQAYGLDPTMLPGAVRDAILLSGLEGYEDTTTKNLSGGWRQRLALSAAILHRPEVIFLDEPTAGVDPISRRAFWDLLYQLVADGITVFITTHYMDEAEHCHRLAFIQRGEITALGTPNQIKEKTMSGKVLEIDCEDPEKFIKEIYQFEKLAGRNEFQAELYGSMIHVLSSDVKAHLKRLGEIASENHIQINNITEIDPSLEDVFIASMGERNLGGNHED